MVPADPYAHVTLLSDDDGRKPKEPEPSDFIGG